MNEMTMSKLQKKLYREIVAKFGDKKYANFENVEVVRLREVLLFLEQLGYIRRESIDNANMYMKIGRFEDFDEWHKDKVREERRLSSHDWRIAIVGALIGLVPFLVTTVIPWCFSMIQSCLS